MKTISSLLRRLLTRLTAPIAPPDAANCLSPRDWADLPVHHPRCPEA